MPKISVLLTDEQARIVDDAVASGDYISASEVVREALREWRGRRRGRNGHAAGLAEAPAVYAPLPPPCLDEAAALQVAAVTASPWAVADQAFVDALAREDGGR